MLLSILNQLPPQSLCPLLGRDEQHFQILAFYPHKRDGECRAVFLRQSGGESLKCRGNIFFDIPNFLIRQKQMRSPYRAFPHGYQPLNELRFSFLNFNDPHTIPSKYSLRRPKNTRETHVFQCAPSMEGCLFCGFSAATPKAAWPKIPPP